MPLEGEAELPAWETAWDAGGADLGLFVPALLREPSVEILAASVDGSIPIATSTSRPTFLTAHGSAPRATRSSSPGGSPSTLPSSRIAPRERNVGNAATSADRSFP